jgi:hypothetical protein
MNALIMGVRCIFADMVVSEITILIYADKGYLRKP